MNKNTEKKAKFDPEVAYNLIIRRLDSFENYVCSHFDEDYKNHRSESNINKFIIACLSLLIFASLLLGTRLHDRISVLEHAQQIEIVDENR